MSDKNHKTLIAVKIKSSRQTREYFWGLVILLGILSFVSAIGGIQYIICLEDNPNIGLMECFRKGRSLHVD